MIDLRTYGRPIGVSKPLVARITRTQEPVYIKRHELAIATSDVSPMADCTGYRAVLTTRPIDEIPLSFTNGASKLVHSVRSLDHFDPGDVVVIHPRTGLIRTLYRPASCHNALLVTERCNSFCLMCSQPPIDRDDSELVEITLEAIRLMEPRPEDLGITGGEPTLLGTDLFRIISALKTSAPETKVHMLTNGRRFAGPKFTEDFEAVRHPKLTLGIPLYSDSAAHHDYVVQAKGAFDQTIQGLHQLARYNQVVEIRVVLHALTIPRLNKLAEYIYRNLPFVSYVALMGLEMTGFTRSNLEKLWIDPYDYQDALEKAVEYLSIRGMNVSIYNHPLCVLRRGLWKFARKSISDWKNIYLAECVDCAVKEQCGGFFKSALLRHSVHIRALEPLCSFQGSQVQ
jgi:His-Xaa-Ser system radical SAM maturase HxsC